MAAKKESGAASAATETTPLIENRNQEGFDQIDNLPQEDQIVKSERSRAAQLQWLLSHTEGSRELVDAVQTIYPRFDKSLLSKAKNAERYGVEICGDALKHLWLTYAPEEYAKRKRNSDGHILTRRLQCRVDDALYEEFIKECHKSGFKDTNECLVELVLYFVSAGRAWNGPDS